MWTHGNDKSDDSVADGEAVIGARSKQVDDPCDVHPGT
jgi:hypothetical protein